MDEQVVVKGNNLLVKHAKARQLPAAPATTDDRKILATLADV
jgi:hypothetical protein